MVGGLVFWETPLCVCRVAGRRVGAGASGLEFQGAGHLRPVSASRSWSPAADGFLPTLADDSVANSDT